MHYTTTLVMLALYCF